MFFRNMLTLKKYEKKFRFFYEIPLSELKKYVRNIVWTPQGKKFGWIIRIRASAKKRMAKVVEVETVRGRVYNFKSDKIIEYKGKLYIIKNSVKETLNSIEEHMDMKSEMKVNLPEKVFEKKNDMPYINEKVIEIALNLVNKAKDIRETILLLDKKLIRGEISLDLFQILRKEFQRQLSIVREESQSILPSFKKYLELKEKYFIKMKERLDSYEKHGGSISEEFKRYVKSTEKEILLLKETLKNIEMDINTKSDLS